jgi:hypothetical protein
MAFVPFTSTDIEAGDPVTQDLWGLVSDNFDDHESRIDDLETAVQTYPPIQFKVRGASSLYAPVTGVEYLRLFGNITLTSGRVFVFTAGSAGTALVDIKYKRGASAFATIFSTPPSVAFGAGDYALSTNGVLSVTALLAGDILRLDVTTAQTDCEEFDAYLTYNVTA